VRLGPRRQGAAGIYAAAGRPPAATPWREARWCSLDLELTGLDPRRDHIIAVGAVPIEDGRVILGEAVYSLVRSSRRSDAGAVVTHKLLVQDLADAPPLDDAIELVLAALSGRVPVFHTAAVERAFLEPQFRRRRLRMPAAADTDALGRLWLRARDGVAPSWISLARLSALLGQRQEPPHHALGDAVSTAQAFIALATHLDARERQTVGSLLSAGERLAGARRMG
jgi:DNA polymerase III subunit epsilon